MPLHSHKTGARYRNQAFLSLGNIRLFSSQNFELNEHQHHNHNHCESNGEPDDPLQSSIRSLRHSLFRDETHGCGLAASTPFTIAQISTMTAIQAFEHI